VAYRMVQMPLTFMKLKVTFAVLNLYNTHNSGNVVF